MLNPFSTNVSVAPNSASGICLGMLVLFCSDSKQLLSQMFFVTLMRYVDLEVY